VKEISVDSSSHLYLAGTEMIPTYDASPVPEPDVANQRQAVSTTVFSPSNGVIKFI
jgi:hypothetical protein